MGEGHGNGEVEQWMEDSSDEREEREKEGGMVTEKSSHGGFER